MARVFVIGDEGEESVLVDGNRVIVGANGHTLIPERTGERSYRVSVGNRPVRVVATEEGGEFSLLVNGKPVRLRVQSERSRFLAQLAGSSPAAEKNRHIVAPMPALVVKLLVSPGETVKPGQGIAVLEAMKMENEIRAVDGGTVSEILVQPGQKVEKGELLVRFA